MEFNLVIYMLPASPCLPSATANTVLSPPGLLCLKNQAETFTFTTFSLLDYSSQHFHVFIPVVLNCSSIMLVTATIHMQSAHFPNMPLPDAPNSPQDPTQPSSPQRGPSQLPPLSSTTCQLSLSQSYHEFNFSLNRPNLARYMIIKSCTLLGKPLQEWIKTLISIIKQLTARYPGQFRH